MKKIIISLCLLFTLTLPVMAQSEANYDESKVPSFNLPPLLINETGKKITTSQEWEQDRRPEILSLLADQEYGLTPEGDYKAIYEVIATNPNALEGKATCKQVKITFTNGQIEHPVIICMYLPKQNQGKSPVFLAYNFKGNQSVNNDPNIIPTSEAERGSDQGSWAIDKIIAAGYGLVTAGYNQFFLDKNNGYQTSVFRLFGINDQKDVSDNGGQALSAWAWGLSRIMDYLETDSEVDSDKVALMGHSRLGKATVWAGANDTRFAIVISNNSGCGGAALSKRCFGETVGRITKSFPYWFCKNFNSYADNEQVLPFDQHELLALVAPRPLYVASAEEDLWADPKGEFLSAKYASDVYKLYGYEGISADEMPQINTPIMNRVGYHIRTGKHAVTDYDWEQYIEFANKYFQ